MKKWLEVEGCIRELDSLPNDRKITMIVLHCTAEPDHADWKGDRSADGIKTFWAEQTKHLGWKEPLGAHFIVSPEGWVYQSFPLSVPVNANSNLQVNQHAISIETVGLFDHGRDTLTPAQSHAIYGLMAGLCVTFGLDSSAVHFHREWNHEKTCPGTSFDLTATREKVGAAKAWAKEIATGK